MKESVVFTVRLAEPSDSRAVWEIRYHPSINLSAAARDHREVSFAQHDTWFQVRYASGSPHRCYVVTVRGEVVAYCRLDKDERSRYEISLAVLPEWQGKGLGSKILTETLRRLETGSEVVAVVHRANPTSAELFTKRGFIRAETVDEYIHFHKTI